MTRQDMWGDDFMCPDYCPFNAICHSRISFANEDGIAEDESDFDEDDFE